MLTVKIISGTYGHRQGKRIVPKDRTSEPFELEDCEAERLVSIGVAKIVNTSVATPKNGEELPPEGVNTPEENNGENDTTDGDDAPLTESELNAMTNAELKEMAESMGIDTLKFKVKKEYVEAILEKVNGDVPPDLGAEDPVV